MPNQRAKNKVRFGGYIEKKLYREIAWEAAREGWTGGVFGYMVHLLEPIVDASHKAIQPRKKSPARPKKTMPRKKR